MLDCGIEDEPGVAVLAVPGSKAFKPGWGERFTGKNVIISAHGNSLRAIVMKLDSLNEQQVRGTLQVCT